MKFDKGMSQILVLIVAAAVLMMVGLLLITLSSGTLTNFQTSITSSGCGQQIKSTCQTSGAAPDEPPTACNNVAPSNTPYLTGDGAAGTGTPTCAPLE